MKALGALGVLLLCLMLQQGIGRVAPAAHGYVDLMLVPVVAYATAGSQRSAMLVGCVGGLLQDAWFQAGAFGLNGFKKTFLGWLLGGVGSRFDLNQQSTAFLAGALASLADDVLDLGLRGLLNQRLPLPGFLPLLGKSLVTALLVVIAFSLVGRLRGGRASLSGRLGRRMRSRRFGTG